MASTHSRCARYQRTTSASELSNLRRGAQPSSRCSAAAVDRVAPVVARAVRDVADQRARSAGPAAELGVDQVADRCHHAHVGALVVAADAIGLAERATLDHREQRLAMILHVQPVADLQAVAVHRQLAPFDRVEDHRAGSASPETATARSCSSSW